MLRAIVDFSNFCALFRGQSIKRRLFANSKLLPIRQSVVSRKPHVRTDKVVLVICKHRVQIVLCCGRIVEVRACELLVLKVDLAISAASGLQHQWIWGQSEVWLETGELQIRASTIVNFVLMHVWLETTLDHWSAVLELVQEAFVCVTATRLGFKRRCANWVGDRPLQQ
jgi:hypothetical protein